MWAPIYGMPVALTFGTMAYYGIGDLVVTTGAPSPGPEYPPGKFEMYHIASGTWSGPYEDPTHRPMSCGSAASDGDGHTYVTRGYTYQTLPSRDFMVFDSRTHRVKLLAPLPVPLAETTMVYDEDGHLYLIGGFGVGRDAHTNGFRANVYRYTIATNTWVTVTEYASPIADNAAAYDPGARTIYLTKGMEPTRAGRWPPRPRSPTAP